MWYRHAPSTSTVEHIIYLCHKPSAKAYSIHVGAFNLDARVAVEQKLPLLSRFIEPNYLASPFLMERPCWQLFDAGRALKWESVFVIPPPKNPVSWPRLFESLFADFIERFFFPIRDCKDMQELLLRNDCPFEWFMTNPVLRIAEIAALGKIAGVDPAILVGRVDAFSEIISRRLPAGVNYRDTVNVVFDQMY
jgi:hypothetical protein